jgi:hypothetical protein
VDRDLKDVEEAVGRMGFIDVLQDSSSFLQIIMSEPSRSVIKIIEQRCGRVAGPLWEGL